MRSNHSNRWYHDLIAGIGRLWEAVSETFPFSTRRYFSVKAALTSPRRLALEGLEPRTLLAGDTLLIAEFMASNQSSLADGDGYYSDWIEVHNASTSAIDLAGYHLTDDATDLDKWTFPSVLLQPGDSTVVFASAPDNGLGGVLSDYVDAGGNLHTNFKLDADGEYLALVDPDGVSLIHEFAQQYPAQRTDISYGIGQTAPPMPLVEEADSGRYLIPTDDGLGTTWTASGFDDAGWTVATTGVGFDDGATVTTETIGNALISRPSTDGANGSIFVLESSPFSQSGSVTEWSMYSQTTREITPLVMQLIGGEYIITGIGASRTSDGSGLQSFAFDLQSGSDQVSSSYFFGWKDGTNGSNNQGVAAWTNGTTENILWFGSSHTTFSTSENLGAGQAFARTYSFQAKVGNQGFLPLIHTDLEADMHNVNASAYFRVPFSVDDPDRLDGLTLRMKYDDGFVAYLNGVEIARRNAPTGTPGATANATTEQPDEQAFAFEDIDVTQYLNALQLGNNNVLAIHGLNRSAADDDFLILPELVAVPELEESLRFFTEPTPGMVNNAGVAGFVEDTQFSLDRGFYDTAFDTVITSATPGATIVYTTDGSEPTLSHGTAIAPPDGNTPPMAMVHVVGTTPLRAAAFKEDYLASNVDTQTYIFVADVVNQATLSTNITNDPVWGPQMQDALLELPTISLVTSNTISQTEQETSIEMIFPDGTLGFQLDAGIEQYGGHSLNYAKKSMRISFKTIYGAAKLNFPILGEGATDAFDQILLRSGSHDTLFYNQSQIESGVPATGGTYIRNRWAFDRQLEMDQPAPHGRFVHLYINGAYHGQFHLMERPNAAFMASYFGGQKDDYDALNAGTPIDGDLTAWNALVAAANADDYEQVQQYLDVENFADYLVLQFYAGNDWDWNPWQNWMASRRREPGAGFQFFAWDSDILMRRGPNANVLGKPGPGNLWAMLKDIDEFRLLVADRAQRYLFNEGMLTPDRVIADFNALASEIEATIIPETSRWQASGPGSYDPDTWQEELDWIQNDYVPNRTNVVIQQMRDAGVLPSVETATFNQRGGQVVSGFDVLLTNPNEAGTIYYTTDGSDPRRVGGAISASAIAYSQPIDIPSATTVKVRILDGDAWSVLDDAAFVVAPLANATNLRITEINFNPHDVNLVPGLGELDVDNDQFEFVELQNIGSETVDLSGVQFVEVPDGSNNEGIEYTFSQQTLAPGEHVLVVRNQAAFESRYGTGLNVAGEYDGKFANGGEQVTLRDSSGSDIQSFGYNDSGNWPGRADGKGASLEVIDTTGDYDSADNWRSSNEFGGSPGAVGTGPIYDVVVNEVLSHGDGAAPDLIELYNTTAAPIDLSRWYLSDTSANFFQFQVSAGTTINAGQHLLFNETQFGFGLDGQFGDDIWLIEADNTTGKPLRLADHQDFDATDANVSLGRWPNGDPAGMLFPMTVQTFGNANSGPVFGDLLISEVHYNPADVPPAEQGNIVHEELEFIELYNDSDSPIDIGNWSVQGIGFTFPVGTTVATGEAIVLVTFDPIAEPTKATAFRNVFLLDAGIRLFGEATGQLNNAGETIRLLRPEDPLTLLTGDVLVDAVAYDELAPWPITADGGGDSLVRTAATDFAPLAISWTAETPNPGSVAFGPPTPGDFDTDGDVDGEDLGIWEGGFGTTTGANSNDGDADSDGDVDGFDFLVWQRNIGSGSAAASGGSAVQVAEESVAVLPEPLVDVVSTVVGPVQPFEFFAGPLTLGEAIRIQTKRVRFAVPKAAFDLVLEDFSTATAKRFSDVAFLRHQTLAVTADRVDMELPDDAFLSLAKSRFDAIEKDHFWSKIKRSATGSKNIERDAAFEELESDKRLITKFVL